MHFLFHHSDRVGRFLSRRNRRDIMYRTNGFMCCTYACTLLLIENNYRRIKQVTCGKGRIMIIVLKKILITISCQRLRPRNLQGTSSRDEKYHMSFRVTFAFLTLVRIGTILLPFTLHNCLCYLRFLNVKVHFCLLFHPFQYNDYLKP